MFRRKITLLVLLIPGLVLWVQGGAAADTPTGLTRAVIEEVNVADQTVSVRLEGGTAKAGHVTTRLENLPVARDARIVIGKNAARLSDLHDDMRVSLRLQVEGGVLINEVQADIAEASRPAGKTRLERAELQKAASDVGMWEARAQWSRRMSRPGRAYVTVAQAEADQAALQVARARLAELQAENRERSQTITSLRAKIRQQRQVLADIEEELRKLQADAPSDGKK